MYMHIKREPIKREPMCANALLFGTSVEHQFRDPREQQELGSS